MLLLPQLYVYGAVPPLTDAEQVVVVLPSAGMLEGEQETETDRELAPVTVTEALFEAEAPCLSVALAPIVYCPGA